jgi:hypothetical protein
MDELELCFSCNGPVEVHRLPFCEPEEWFIKCDKCPSTSTLAYLRREDAVKEWNTRWGYQEIKRLQATIGEMKKIGLDAYNRLTEDERTLKHRFEQLFNAFVKMKLENSGSWGNLSKEDQRQKIVNEIMYDLGWTK